jgi:osmotically inducible lipoprotein OsmB
MNRKTLVGAMILLTCGCTGMQNTDNGMATGGILGGILGLGVGCVTHHPLAGAAIGAGAGALAGGAIGHAEDKKEARDAAAYQAAHPPLTLEDIARMSQQHLSDAIIIEQIRTTNSFFNLQPEHIAWLKQMGVSDPVVLEMQSRVPGRVVYTAAQPDVVIVQPQPVVGVGIGYGYGYGRRW